MPQHGERRVEPQPVEIKLNAGRIKLAAHPGKFIAAVHQAAEFLEHFMVEREDLIAEPLRQNCLHHIPGHIGQAKVPSGISEDQAFVIQAQQVENRRVQVMNMHFVLHRAKAMIIGCAVHKSAFHAAARAESRSVR